MNFSEAFSVFFMRKTYVPELSFCKITAMDKLYVFMEQNINN